MALQVVEGYEIVKKIEVSKHHDWPAYNDCQQVWCACQQANFITVCCVSAPT
jgi:hypothetical protein